MAKLTRSAVSNTKVTALTNSKGLQKAQRKPNATTEKDLRGQYLGASLIALFGGIILVLGLMDHEWLAGSIATTVVINIAGILNKAT